jgi:hypothetical protein
LTRARPDQTVPVSLRTFECGHLLNFTIAPPRIGQMVLCPSCSVDDPPRRVIKAERYHRE